MGQRPSFASLLCCLIALGFAQVFGQFGGRRHWQRDAPAEAEDTPKQHGKMPVELRRADVAILGLHALQNVLQRLSPHYAKNTRFKRFSVHLRISGKFFPLAFLPSVGLSLSRSRQCPPGKGHDHGNRRRPRWRCSSMPWLRTPSSLSRGFGTSGLASLAPSSSTRSEMHGCIIH